MAAHSLPTGAPTQPAGSTLVHAARQVLEGYPERYRPHQTTSAESAGPVDSTGFRAGFSGAHVWRLETPSGPQALRAMPALQVDLVRLRGLHRLLAHVAQAGVDQVAVPVSRRDGSTFLVHDSLVWQLEPWKPGCADFQRAPAESRLRAALSCLAAFHKAAHSFRATLDEQNWFFTHERAHSPGLSERLARIRRWDNAACQRAREAVEADDWVDFRSPARRILELYECLAPRIAGELQVGVNIFVPLQPCLRDVWHDHLLFTGNTVTGLIDPHACRSDCVATDLARLLGSLVADNRTLWDAGVDEYQRVRSLRLEERGLVELFDRSAIALSGLTWLEWRYSERRAFADAPAALERLAAIVRRMELLATRT